MKGHAFWNARAVKQFLKQHGFTERVQVRRTASPFNGETFFLVALPGRDGVPSLSFGGSKEPTHWGWVEGAGPAEIEKATVLNQLEELLRGTNGIPMGRN